MHARGDDGLLVSGDVAIWSLFLQAPYSWIQAAVLGGKRWRKGSRGMAKGRVWNGGKIRIGMKGRGEKEGAG